MFTFRSPFEHFSRKNVLSIICPLIRSSFQVTHGIIRKKKTKTGGKKLTLLLKKNETKHFWGERL
jgi:hypothetical protein